MITSERELEDYICNSQDKFITALNDIYGSKNEIHFIGRQVNVGTQNRIDLLYYFDKKLDDNCPEECETIERNYIVVELKFRQAEVGDLTQIARYMAVLNDKALELEHESGSCREVMVHGVLVSDGMSDGLKLISCAGILHNIDFLYADSTLNFIKEGDYYFTRDCIEKLVVDKRIENLYSKRVENDK